MRTWNALCALACLAGAASAQQTRPALRSATPAARAAIDTLRLTRREAIDAAVSRNPQIAVAREGLRQARSRRVQSIAIPDPIVTASLDNEPRLLQLGGATEKNVGVELDVPFPDKYRWLNRIGTADVHSADFQLTLARQDIAAQAARAYDELLLQQRHRRDLLEGQALADSFLAKAQVRFNAGAVARLDVIKAQVDVAQARNDLIANERDITNALGALNRFLNRPQAAPIVTLDSLGVPPALPELDVLTAAARTARPEIGDLEAQRAGAHASTALAREFWLPDLFISATRDYTTPGSQLYSAGVAFPIPLLFWQHSRGDIAEAQQYERQLAAVATDLLASVEQDVREAYATADAALRQVIYLRDNLEPSAREAFRVASVSYGLGGSSALEVLDARRTLLDAESQLAEALANANSSRSDLERAVGRPLGAFAPQSPGGSRD